MHAAGLIDAAPRTAMVGTVGTDGRRPVHRDRRRDPGLGGDLLLLSANAGGDVNAGLVDTSLVTQAAAAALLVNQVAKLLAARRRPHVFSGTTWYAKSEDNLSFYGGHRPSPSRSLRPRSPWPPCAATRASGLRPAWGSRWPPASATSGSPPTSTT